MNITAWLHSLGLERYGQAFRENEVNESALLKLTTEDLKGLRVIAVGHRRILLDATANLRRETSATHDEASRAKSPIERTTHLRRLSAVSLQTCFVT
jgi:hypothetical protein